MSVADHVEYTRVLIVGYEAETMQGCHYLIVPQLGGLHASIEGSLQHHVDAAVGLQLVLPREHLYEQLSQVGLDPHYHFLGHLRVEVSRTNVHTPHLSILLSSNPDYHIY